MAISAFSFKGLWMNGGFEDRKKAFENKWAHDEALRFKVMARRAKLLGLWAAGEMGLSAAEAETYAREVAAADMAEAGDEDIFRKVKQDLEARNVARSEYIIRKKMDELLAVAKEQMMHEVK
jgi:hypothetical protein